MRGSNTGFSSGGFIAFFGRVTVNIQDIVKSVLLIDN